MSFTRSMAQTYVSATLGNMVSQLVMRGYYGGAGKVDMGNVFLVGLQVGTSFIAYPVAIQILRNKCKKFRDNMDDPKGNKLLTYAAGGATAALIVTAVNYPISRIQMAYNNKKVENFCKEFFGFYADQIGSSIGFAATMGTVAPLVPSCKDSLSSWARNLLLVNVSNVGGSLFAWPIRFLRHNASLPSMVLGNIRNIPGVMFTGDSSAQYRVITGFINQ